MSDFRFTPEAAADLFEIWTYIVFDNQRRARLRSSVSCMACRISRAFCELRSLKFAGRLRDDLSRRLLLPPHPTTFLSRPSTRRVHLLLSSQHAIVLHPRVFPAVFLSPSAKHEEEFIVTKHKTTRDATQSPRKRAPCPLQSQIPRNFRHPSDTCSHPQHKEQKPADPAGALHGEAVSMPG